MKKMFMILMMALTMVAAFAKPIARFVTFKGEKCLLLTDDENKQRDWGNLSDTEIVKRVKNAVPTEIHGVKYEYAGFIFNDEINEPAEKYYSYWLICNDGTMFVDENLGDGRMVRLVYLMDLSD